MRYVLQSAAGQGERAAPQAIDGGPHRQGAAGQGGAAGECAAGPGEGHGAGRRRVHGHTDIAGVPHRLATPPCSTLVTEMELKFADTIQKC